MDGFAQEEVDWILGVGGIELRVGVRLGRDIDLADLRRDYAAVFLGLGLGAVNTLGIDEDGLDGVMDAVAYIAALRQAPDLAALPVGRHIVVIGGGMTAIDIASQTKRLGAEDVTIVYRRGQEQMNASQFEQELAQTDGVLLRHWLQPTRLLAEDGKLSAVEFEYTDSRTGTLTLPCSQLFKAIGQAFLPADVDGSRELVELEHGRIAVDAERRTSLSGIWAGGDCVAGGKDLTVTAVEDGKQAALSIDRALRAATAARAA